MKKQFKNLFNEDKLTLTILNPFYGNLLNTQTFSLNIPSSILMTVETNCFSISCKKK